MQKWEYLTIVRRPNTTIGEIDRRGNLKPYDATHISLDSLDPDIDWANLDRDYDSQYVEADLVWSEMKKCWTTFDRELRRLGECGWELVGIEKDYPKHSTQFIFKRPKQYETVEKDTGKDQVDGLEEDQDEDQDEEVETAQAVRRCPKCGLFYSSEIRQCRSCLAELKP